jgi:site-specific DNA recombinase
VVQFQGMIAEYERAQIAERCRRGKRHRAQQGMVNVLSGAPYGYRYVRKSESSSAYYEVIEAEAQVVRMVLEAYTQQALSINAIARMLNERRIPTRSAATRWERSTVWGMLRNPAYCGKACYGKTELRPRAAHHPPAEATQRSSQPGQRQPWAAKAGVDRSAGSGAGGRGNLRNGSGTTSEKRTPFAAVHDWADAAAGHAGVSAVRIRTESDIHANIQTESPLLSLPRLGWISSAQRSRMYEPASAAGQPGPACVGWNHSFVGWSVADPERDRPPPESRFRDQSLGNREEDLRREQARLEKNMERIISAYQEALVKLPQLRQRMPELHRQIHAVEAELHSLEIAAVDDARYLQLAETLATFRGFSR